MESLRNKWIYYLIHFLNFYLIPLLMKDTGSGMMIMLVIIPLVCFMTSLLYGFKNEFHLLHILIIILMYIPTIFLSYNPSAWVYTLVYGCIAFVGNVIVVIFKKSNY